jgi:COMPASS component SWD2
MASEIKFTQDTMKQFNVAKSFTVNKDRINAMNFSLDGETLISSSDDDSIVIYDCKEGEYVLIYLINLKYIIFLFLF